MTDRTLPKHRLKHITAVNDDTDGQKDREPLKSMVTTALPRATERKELTVFCECKPDYLEIRKTASVTTSEGMQLL